MGARSPGEIRWSQKPIFWRLGFALFQTGSSRKKREVPKLAQISWPHHPRASVWSHLYERICGEGGHKGPQQVAAAPTLPRPAAVTSQASALASGDTGKTLVRSSAPAPNKDLGLRKTLPETTHSPPPRPISALPPLSVPFSRCPGSRGVRSQVPAGGVPRPQPAGTLGTAGI